MLHFSDAGTVIIATFDAVENGDLHSKGSHFVDEVFRIRIYAFVANDVIRYVLTNTLIIIDIVEDFIEFCFQSILCCIAFFFNMIDGSTAFFITYETAFFLVIPPVWFSIAIVV